MVEADLKYFQAVLTDSFMMRFFLISVRRNLKFEAKDQAEDALGSTQTYQARAHCNPKPPPVPLASSAVVYRLLRRASVRLSILVHCTCSHPGPVPLLSPGSCKVRPFFKDILKAEDPGKRYAN